MLPQIHLADELGLGRPTESIAIIEGTELVCFAPTVLVPGPCGKGFALSIHLLIPSGDEDAFRIVDVHPTRTILLLHAEQVASHLTPCDSHLLNVANDPCRRPSFALSPLRLRLRWRFADLFGRQLLRG